LKVDWALDREERTEVSAAKSDKVFMANICYTMKKESDVKSGLHLYTYLTPHGSTKDRWHGMA